LHSANILAMHGTVNVKLNGDSFLSSVIRKMGFCARIVKIHQFIKLTYIYIYIYIYIMTRTMRTFARVFSIILVDLMYIGPCIIVIVEE